MGQERRLIWQCYVPPTMEHFTQVKDPNWWKVSVNHVKKYAKRIGADYKFFGVPYMKKEGKLKGGIYYEKTRIMDDEFFDQYDVTCYLDVDIIPDPDAPSIFESVNVEYAAQARLIWDHDRDKREGLREEAERHFNYYNLSCPVDSDGTPIWRNSGVMLWTRQGLTLARETFVPLKDYDQDKSARRWNGDESYWNIMFKYANFPIETVPPEWNAFVNNDHEVRYMHHYVGIQQKELMVKHYGKTV